MHRRLRHVRGIVASVGSIFHSSTPLSCAERFCEEPLGAMSGRWTERATSSSHMFTASAASTSAAEGRQEAEGCWNCDSIEREPDYLFCPACGVITPIDGTQSHHSLMSVREGAYSVDYKLLDRQYKRLQRQLHPDRFSQKSQREKEISEEASSQVNEAYTTLKDPLKRGQYLLDQRGLGDSEGVIESPELLTTVMGAREAIEDTEDVEVLQKYNEIFNLQSKSCVQALAVAFEHDDMKKAQNLVTSLRYISNIQAAILEKL